MIEKDKVVLTDKEMREIEMKCDSMYSMGRAVEAAVLASSDSPSMADAALNKLTRYYTNGVPSKNGNYVRFTDVERLLTAPAAQDSNKE